MAGKLEEIAVHKLISHDNLTVKELQEVIHLSVVDLMLEYGFSLDLAREVTNCIRKEAHRHRAQGFTWPESSEDPRKEFGYPIPPTRTRPIVESKKNSKKMSIKELRTLIEEMAREL